MDRVDIIEYSQGAGVDISRERLPRTLPPRGCSLLLHIGVFSCVLSPQISQPWRWLTVISDHINGQGELC